MMSPACPMINLTALSPEREVQAWATEIDMSAEIAERVTRRWEECGLPPLRV